MIWRFGQAGVANPMTAAITFWGWVNERAMDPLQEQIAHFRRTGQGRSTRGARETSAQAWLRRRQRSGRS
jgi:hypothetical protein